MFIIKNLKANYYDSYFFTKLYILSLVYNIYLNIFIIFVEVLNYNIYIYFIIKFKISLEKYNRTCKCLIRIPLINLLKYIYYLF